MIIMNSLTQYRNWPRLTVLSVFSLLVLFITNGCKDEEHVANPSELSLEIPIDPIIILETPRVVVHVDPVVIPEDDLSNLIIFNSAEPSPLLEETP